MGFFSTSVAVLAAVSLARGLSTCASTGARPQYDYVIVGAGAGGGPLATRLAEAGFSGKISSSSATAGISLTAVYSAGG